MSSTTSDTAARPWHGSENPYEAIYQWVQGELAKVKAAPGAVQTTAPPSHQAPHADPAYFDDAPRIV